MRKDRSFASPDHHAPPGVPVPRALGDSWGSAQHSSHEDSHPCPLQAYAVPRAVSTLAACLRYPERQRINITLSSDPGKMDD